MKHLPVVILLLILFAICILIGKYYGWPLFYLIAGIIALWAFYFAMEGNRSNDIEG